MQFRSVSFLAAIAAASVVVGQTSPPPQLCSIYKLGMSLEHQATSYRMTNNGSTTSANLLACVFLVGDTTDAWYRGGYFSLAGYTDLDRFLNEDGVVAGATCGLYTGLFGGYSDGVDAVGFSPPAWWQLGSPQTKSQVWWDGNSRPGKFWDINYDGSAAWFVGYYENGSGVKQPARWTPNYGTNAPSFFIPPSGFEGGELWALNKNLDFGGQLIDLQGANIPVVYKNTGTESWNLIKVSDHASWPSGRSGVVTGITDRNSGDSNGPYAAGYLESGSGIPAQPFIYSVGSQELKFCGQEYGRPQQISNADYSASDPIIQFVGNSATSGAYIYIGSPDPDAVLSGVGNDMWAVFDPDVSVLGTGSPTVTGLNSAFAFGGTGFPENGAPGTNAWITKPETDWSRVTGTGSLVKGTHDTGSSNADIEHVDGWYAQITNGPVLISGDAGIVYEVTSANMGSPGAIAFRATAKLPTNFGATLKIQFKNYSSGAWDTIATQTSMKTYWVTLLAKKDSSFSDYLSSGVAKARITVTQTGPSPGGNWQAAFEQGVWMKK